MRYLSAERAYGFIYSFLAICFKRTPFLTMWFFIRVFASKYKLIFVNFVDSSKFFSMYSSSVRCLTISLSSTLICATSLLFLSWWGMILPIFSMEMTFLMMSHFWCFIYIWWQFNIKPSEFITDIFLKIIKSSVESIWIVILENIEQVSP